MSIILELPPEIEKSLLAQAQAHGVSLSAYVQEIVAREARTGDSASSPNEANNLLELFEMSPFKGLSMEFERDRDYGREIDL